MNAHTPGPWRIQPTSMRGQFLVSGGDIRQGDGFSLQFSEGNARLIAAAPEMLEALIAMDKFTWEEGLSTANPAIAQMRAAIAKAEGKS